MDLYFERHDGEATTIEAFIKCFEDANGRDLQHFQRWYLQAGTPKLTVAEEYDAAARRYTLDFTQTNPPTPDQPEKQPMVIPVKFGLVGPNGAPATWTSVSGGTVEEDMIVIDGAHTRLIFEGVANRPVPSLLRGFSAPVILETGLGEADQLFLARHDSDPFNRWQALQEIATALLTRAARGTAWSAESVTALAAAIADTIRSAELDDAFKANVLSLPSELNIAQVLGSDVDPDAIHAVRVGLIAALATEAGPALRDAYARSALTAPYSPDAGQAGKRALRQAALAFLVRGGADGAPALAREQYESATNMSDRYGALAAVVTSWTDDAPALLADFRGRFGADPLVLDKWLALNATPAVDGTLERVQAILAEPDFPRNNPNRLRALVGSFASANPVQFARADGAGFRFVASFVADVDKRNPQVASRILTAFRNFRTYEPRRRAAAETVLHGLADGGGLSRNVTDILERMLAG
jgi:aminopeptidase N